MSPLPRHFVSCFTLPMLLSVKKIATVSFVTSPTCAFAGDFVDFQSDFFSIFQAILR